MSLSSQSPAVAAFNPFLDRILARAVETPAQLMGVFHDGETWQALDQQSFMDRACCFAAYLQAAGVGRQDVVLLILPHGPDAYAAFIGTMLLGAVPSFLPLPSIKQDAAVYWQQHRDVFAHIRPAAMLVEDGIKSSLAGYCSDFKTILLGMSGVASHQAMPVATLPEGRSVALLQHSSGTTGLKKGVQLSYEAICKQILSYAAALGLDGVAEARFASWLPLYHDMGLISSFLMPVWLGIPIISIDPFEWTARPALFFEAIETYRATHAWVPNFALLHQVRTARQATPWDLSSLAALISCSEPCKPASFDAFVTKFAACGITAETLQTCYAMAETVFAVTQSTPGATVRRLTIDRASIEAGGGIIPAKSPSTALTLLSNGKPIAGCEINILRDGSFQTEGQIGEICVRSTCLFEGYYKNPETTRTAFHGPWFRTGDLGCIDQGELFIVGRLKDVIIINGKNIFAHDVEAAVSTLPGVKPGRVAAFGSYVERMGTEELIVMAEPAPTDADADEVIRLINRTVSEQVGIACGDIRIVESGWLIKTTSGKMSRADNLKKYTQQFKISGSR